MISGRILTCVKIVAVCSFLLASGCISTAEKPAKPEAAIQKQAPEATGAEKVTVALKFKPQQSTTYRLITEAKRTLEFEGSFSDNADLKGGSNDGKIDMTFTQQIQSVDEKGNAVAKITIKKLKVFSTYKDKPVLDFDSTREADQNSPLGKLIGRNYLIEIAPTGQVTKVIDAEQERSSLTGTSVADKAALKLLSTDAIKQRHSVYALPAAGKNQLRIGQTWSTLQAFSFDIMGSESYEKIFTLKQIKDHANRQIAIADMKAIPASESPEQSPEEQAASSFLDMFDNTETYLGRLEFDLTSGEIEKYSEQLKSDWVAAEPLDEEKSEKIPGVMKMGAVRLYNLERVD